MTKEEKNKLKQELEKNYLRINEIDFRHDECDCITLQGEAMELEERNAEINKILESESE